MRLCETCGNDIDPRVSKCVFCGSLVRPEPPRSGNPSRRINTVNLKTGLPVVAEAMRRLVVGLQAARSKGAGLVRVIHGYGSGGEGGRIKAAARKRLREMERRGEIKDLVPGEEYSESGKQGAALINDYPALKSTLRTDRRNPGITFVKL